MQIKQSTLRKIIREEISSLMLENDVEQKAKRHGYEPYRGGGGADVELQNKNTRVLKKVLDDLGVGTKLDKLSKYIPIDDNGEIVIVLNDGRTIGYDRNGFVGTGRGPFDLDQGGIGAAVKWATDGNG